MDRSPHRVHVSDAGLSPRRPWTVGGTQGHQRPGKPCPALGRASLKLGRVSPAQTGPGRIAVDWSPADNQQPPHRHLDQGCALPRTGAEAGGGPLNAHFTDRELRHPPQQCRKRAGTQGLCRRRGTLPTQPPGKAPPESATFPQSATAGVGGGGAVQRVRAPLITQNSSAASPQPRPRAESGCTTFFLGRLCLSEPPANAHPEPPRS